MSVKSRAHWVNLAGAATPNGDAFIDGVYVEPRSGRRFDTINPATERTIASIAACGESDVDAAVATGRKAFNSGDWSHASPAERKVVLLRIAQLVEEHREELAVLESIDTGKLITEAYDDDITQVAEVFRWYAESIDKIYDEIAPTGRTDFASITREPLGVVAAIVPWNFPLLIAAWKLAPALAVGNSVVIKPAERASLSILRFAELASQGGLPPGVLNAIPGEGAVAGRALALHPDVDCVCFTGSTAVGKLMLRYSGESNMKQVWLECGGKSPNIVFGDVEDLKKAAERAAFGIFYYQGQVCSAASRLLVHRSIHADLVAAVLEEARGRVPGDPLDPATTMGALIDRSHSDDVLEKIEAGRRAGQLIMGGGQVTVDGAGCFIEPTIFDNVDVGSKLATQEIFGPVLSVIPFDDEAEAIELANRSNYGLAASVWTNDLRRAHRVARAVHAGTVSVNTVDAISSLTPFGGFKQSGIGRDLSLHALDKYTGLKTTWIDLS